ncbi:MAG TPA: hypothetical protein EYG31_12725 [Porticoccaceae bacterium]|nr:hypothetical protein [Gammaproteobacteria bacterium]HIL61488.1 hypothetical protein [Porticoccaceae bacterium]
MSLNSYAQEQPKREFIAGEFEAPLQQILAAGCSIFLVEEIDPGGIRFLQVFELEDGTIFAPRVNEHVRTLSTERANQGTGGKTYQRYLSRLETALAADENSNSVDADLVVMPIGSGQNVAISIDAVAEMNAYQFLLMESQTADLFRARRESFLSIFPDQNMNIQIDSLLSVCADIHGLEEALLILEKH